MSASRPPSHCGSSVDSRAETAPVASGESPTSSPTVIGRDRELVRIDDLLAAAATGRCGALLIEGEPGAGKTTLLTAARARADGFICLTAVGVETDSQLGHAGLLQMLRPIRSLVPGIPDGQAAALRSALGWSPVVSAADRFLVGAATLSVLAAAAERRPVLVIVDDLQWLDRESAAALVFAARRLGDDAVAFLFAGRTGTLGADLIRDFPVLTVTGLAGSDVKALLPVGIAAAVLDQLVASTGGNPLAVVEAGRQLTTAQRVGAAPLPDPLPSGRRLNEIYRAALAGLTPQASQAALLLALAGAAPTATSLAAAVLTETGIDPVTALDEARVHGVLVSDGVRYGFRHPLLRSAVLELASPVQRRTAHAALAAALPPADTARIWHLAESIVGTDAALAEELVRTADAARDRLGHAAASAALERASDLSPDPAVAAGWLAAAAADAFIAGDVSRVRTLVRRVLAADAADRARGQALFTLGMLEQYAGSVPSSVGHLDQAATLLDGVEMIRALCELALARFRLNDVAGMVECAARIDAGADPTDPEQLLLASFTGGVALVLTGDHVAGMPRLAEVRRLADVGHLRTDARALLLLALTSAFTGRIGDALAVGVDRVPELRRRGAVGVLVPTLALMAAGKAWLGDHSGAFADAGEAAELAADLGYTADASVAVEMLAWQLAARGLHDQADESLAAARELVERSGTATAAAHHSLTRAFCALCRGDVGEVVALLEARIAVDGGVGAEGQPLGVAPLLVEAYVALGRTAEARSMTARYQQVTPSAARPLSTALAARCQLLTALDDAAAASAFDAALAAHAEAADLFETARTRLLYGSRLRRTGQRIAARAELQRAADSFAAMDLSHWSAVAAAELAATGATVRRRAPGADEPLTSQETRVALLAAEGLSNREIGASLFLSPKTVERHLSSVFAKRGFRSRSQLAAFFARSPGTAG